VNANPCLSPDSSLVKAGIRAGLGFDDIVARILEDLEPASCRSRAVSWCLDGETDAPQAAVGGSPARTNRV